jgi:hypothetical protein
MDQQQVESQQALTDNVEAVRLETREAFNHLIIANEATRDLATQMGKLIVNVSQRLSFVEQSHEEQNGKR